MYEVPSASYCTTLRFFFPFVDHKHDTLFIVIYILLKDGDFLIFH